MTGEEWVINSVSRNGVHKATDVWRGPPKLLQKANGPAQFIYTAQFLAGECPRRRQMLSFCCEVLDALGLRNGAAHTELVWSKDGPRLLEVNARPAGGLPRTPSWPNQLEALAMSVMAPQRFEALPFAPHSAAVGVAVVFLRAPR